MKISRFVKVTLVLTVGFLALSFLIFFDSQGNYSRFETVVEAQANANVKVISNRPPPVKVISNRPPPANSKPVQKPSVSPVPPQITVGQEFYYLVAVYGYARTKTWGKPYDEEGYDNVDFYGETFDYLNYKSAMADEFERNRYRTRISAKIEDEVRKVNFNQKFTSIDYRQLGEYSFERHAFPFGSQHAVNRNQFATLLPMSETDASAFVKRRSTASGNINRTVKVRTIYSIVNDKAGFSLKNAVYTPYFNYFTHSVEVFSDEDMTLKLGVIPRISLVPNTQEEWRLAKVAAQTATKEIGKYQHIASCRKSIRSETPAFGTITLTDVGITVYGKWSDGSSWVKNYLFINRQKSSSPSRFNKTYDMLSGACGEFHFEGFDGHVGLDFETEQERDRFFTDFSLSFQEWQTKYTLFEFPFRNFDY
jgi:Domain of unknown function (DUF4852)